MNTSLGILLLVSSIAQLDPLRVESDVVPESSLLAGEIPSEEVGSSILAGTLFRWPGQSVAEQDAIDETIVTDRPDFTEASSTVSRGRVQLEMGYTYVKDDGSEGNSHEHRWGEPLLRVGTFADWLELRVGWAYIDQGGHTVDGLSTAVSGSDDLYLGTKIGLTRQHGWLPEMAIMPQMFVHVGAPAIGHPGVRPGANWLYGWDVNDWFAWGGSTQINRAIDDNEKGFGEFAQSLTGNFALSDRLGMYTEWFAFMPFGSSGTDTGVYTEHYADGGFTYLITDTIQWDIRAGIGLSRHASDYFVGTGLSVRFGK